MAITPIQVLISPCFEAALNFMDEKNRGFVAQTALQNPDLKFAPDAVLFLLSKGFFKDTSALRKGPFKHRRLCGLRSIERLRALQQDEKLIELLRRNFSRNFPPQEGDAIDSPDFDKLNSLSPAELLATFDTPEKCEHFVRSMIQKMGTVVSRPREASVLSKIVEALISVEDEEKRVGSLCLWAGTLHFFSLEYGIDSRRNTKVAERLWTKAFDLATQGRFRFLQVLLETNHASIQKCLARNISQIIIKKELPTLLSRLVSCLDSESAYLIVRYCYNEKLFWETCSKDVVQKLSEDRKKDVADFLVKESSDLWMFGRALKVEIPFESMSSHHRENVKNWVMKKIRRDLLPGQDEAILDAIKGFEWILEWLPPESPFLQTFINCYQEAQNDVGYLLYYADISLFFIRKKWKCRNWMRFTRGFYSKSTPQKLRNALSMAHREKDIGLVDQLCLSFGANLTQQEIDDAYNIL